MIGPLVIDTVMRTAPCAGRLLGLLPREFVLLHHLARHDGRVVRKKRNAPSCGGALHPGTNLVAVHVSRLRARLDGGGEAAMLRIERGTGYRLVAP